MLKEKNLRISADASSPGPAQTQDHCLEQSLEDEKIMDPKPPNLDLRAGAGPHPHDPGAEDSGHGT